MGTDSEVELFKRYYEVCQDLNLDKNATDEAWRSFQGISMNYTLEGDKLHWLACALYVSCRRGVTPTVGGGRGTYIEGNCVSLTRLLRSCRLSLVEFFRKMTKSWSDMAKLTGEMREKIKHLERNFYVSTIIFNKYKHLFNRVFKEPINSPAKPKSKKAAKKLTVSTNEIFSLCWTLFISVKSEFSIISDDLISSYYLLLAAIDFCYANALVSEHATELLNPNFSELPDDYQTGVYRDAESIPCIVKALCSSYDSLYVEAAGVKEHWWRPAIKRMIEKKILRCRASGDFLGIFDTAHFEYNHKSVNRDYEQYVLKIGDFDERVFLLETADQELGTPETSADELTERLAQRQLMKQHLEETKTLTPMTPLSNRHYLKESITLTPVSSATQTVSQLHSLLIDRKDKPSPALIELFAECQNNPEDIIAQRVTEMGEKFITAYSRPGDQERTGADIFLSNEFAKKRLELTVALYYKSLENIMGREKRRLQSQPVDRVAEGLANLLGNEVFHVALFTCCAEVVLFSYSSKRTFPWIIQVFADFRDLRFQAFHFYRVIELLVRDEDGLARSVVKHLNFVEESILESVAWQSNSALWDAIATQTVPSCQEVSLPTSDGVPPSPLTAIRRYNRDPFASPVPSAAADRFQSPINSSARRRLFDTGPVVQNGTDNQQIVIIQTQTASGEVRTIQVPAYIVPANSNTTTTTEAKAELPRRTGAVGLFFRKVYNLAWVRLRDLCDRLNINDDELKRKIWTCFELSIKNHTKLMKDRHLDQLLMCAIYAVSKSTGNEVTFTNIMKSYRLQPQACSQTYRSVLLENRGRRNSTSDNSNGSTSPSEEAGKESIRSSSTLPVPAPNSQPPTPTRLGGSVNFEFGEDRGDLIMFYNQIYVPEMKEFLLRFSMTAETPLLSPLPRLAAHPLSPYRRISQKHSLFVSPMKASSIPPSPNRPFSYSILRSPAKDLKTINQMMRLNGVERKGVSKRIFQDDSDAPEHVKKVCTDPPVFRSKVQAVFSEQRASGGDPPNQ